jgi:RNA-directed DNA polymerase
MTFHASLKDELAKLGLNIGEIGEPGSKTIIYSPNEPAEFLGMELVRSPTAECHLRVGGRSTDKIVQRINSAGTCSAFLERKVSLTTMGTYFRNLQAGYLNAYDGAQDRDDLEAAMGRLVARRSGGCSWSFSGTQGSRSWASNSKGSSGSNWINDPT